MDYYGQIQIKMDNYVHFVYKLTKKFPIDELYGSTSQLRRASLSVILNYIEGFARKKSAVKKNFWEISYGSLKESKYLLNFGMVESYINKDEYVKAEKLSDEIGAMLWKATESLKDS
jgi:four helix bundle protein